ncbi:hypothetical protein EST38_g13101 [Candolleomyces aberdarensis]|uniref:PARP catalytic domain-containing protein n=1 Tax=Candolleomyces aberdarensis TaxID=2316362 RepID=A0A4Q2D2V7_9AGAR|nr:hypothetical protein EST38_g13101 [Candolleomyces aberdarensis]
MPYYPAELDSDDEGSIEYDWDNDSQPDLDDVYMGRTMGHLRLGGSTSGVPGTPPPRYSSVPTPPPGYAAGSLVTPGMQSQASIQPERQILSYLRADLCIEIADVCPRWLKQQKHVRDFVTCGLTCNEKLCKDGPSDTTMCTYCHRRLKVQGKDQCGQTCADKAKIACLLCKVRPKNGSYHFCGKACKGIATKSTPLILEIAKGHTSYDMVENKFKSGWKGGSPPPTIAKIFKIIENEEFLKPYDAYRKRVGPKENYLYHGTKRQCQLGVSTTKLCASSTCAICNILKTSFKVEIANPWGRFGKGIYTSSASNKAFGYSAGVMLLNKVVLGNVGQASGSSCPSGYDSVVYDPQGASNETILYTNDAIRPVFLIAFQ